MAELVHNGDTDAENVRGLPLDFRTGERRCETQRRGAHPLVIRVAARRIRRADALICDVRVAHLHAFPERQRARGVRRRGRTGRRQGDRRRVLLLLLLVQVRRQELRTRGGRARPLSGIGAVDSCFAAVRMVRIRILFVAVGVGVRVRGRWGKWRATAAVTRPEQVVHTQADVLLEELQITRLRGHQSRQERRVVQEVRRREYTHDEQREREPRVVSEHVLDGRLQLDRALERRELLADAERTHRVPVRVRAHETLGAALHRVNPAAAIQVVAEEHRHLRELHQASLFITSTGHIHEDHQRMS